MRWQDGGGGRVVRWDGGRFLLLFRGRGHRVSPRFIFLFLLVKGKNRWIGFKIFLRSSRDGKTLPRSSVSS